MYRGILSEVGWGKYSLWAVAVVGLVDRQLQMQSHLASPVCVSPLVN